MKTNKTLKIGLVGTVIAAICCLTPVLVVLFGVFGLSALVAYLDLILLPLLCFFLGLSLYGYWGSKRARQSWYRGSHALSAATARKRKCRQIVVSGFMTVKGAMRF